MIDDDGKRYLDFVAGIAVNALGHADAGVMNAMREAMETGLIHTSNLYRTAPGERLAEWLVDALVRVDSVFFCNSGAEANEGAFKFARRWGRGHGGASKHEIIALRGAFHGRMPGTLAATDRPAYRLPFRPLMGGVTIVERDLDELRRGARSRDGGGGDRRADPGRGRRARGRSRSSCASCARMTRERNVLLILDEIQCGLGRTGTLFAYETIGIEPDMVTLAKPLAGGLPMGAILVTADVATSIQPGDHGTTFGGGPFVAQSRNTWSQRLADPALLAHVRETGAWFGEQLQAMAERTGARARDARRGADVGRGHARDGRRDRRARVRAGLLLVPPASTRCASCRRW